MRVPTGDRATLSAGVCLGNRDERRQSRDLANRHAAEERVGAAGRSNPGTIVDVTWDGGSLFLDDPEVIGEFKTSKLLVQHHKVETRA